MNNVLIGIDIGGTKIATAVADPEGNLISRRRIPTRSDLGPAVALDGICLSIEELVAENNARVIAIGVGCPGPLDIENGLVLSPANLRTWNRVPIVEKLSDHFGVDIAFDNDANAAALGECSHGAGQGFRNVFYVTISTGIGGGIVLDGAVYHGVANGAGEVGHSIVKPDGIRCNCGSIGCLETICSGTHITRRIKERINSGEPSLLQDLAMNGSEPSAEMLIGAIRQEDRVACELWDETCRYLAVGLGNAITILAPDVLIVGGGISAAGDLLLDPLRELIPKYVSMIPPECIRVVPAALGQDSGLYGAVALARTVIADRSALNAAYPSQN